PLFARHEAATQAIPHNMTDTWSRSDGMWKSPYCIQKIFLAGNQSNEVIFVALTERTVFIHSGKPYDS
ncbi:unnamed protein product, partial [Cercopithifilaria johnstoni]